jgi:ribonuclease R
VGEPYFEGGRPLVVDRKGAGDAAVGDLVVLRAGRGRAKLEGILGRADHIEAVLEGLLRHEGVRRERPPLREEPSGSEPERVDLRELTSFTIDPEDAKDFDDALSLRE